MGKVLRLLLIEDSANDAILILRELKKLGYQAIYEQVDSLKDLNKALDKDHWDIAISDYILQGFSGLDALKQLRKRVRTACIIVSGGSMTRQPLQPCSPGPRFIIKIT
jgi:sigma-B regulation protein RsbU (phosphoserine phosphatase)